MKPINHALICLFVIFTVVTPRAGFSQAHPANDWQVVQSLPIGQKLSAKLKNGKTVDGLLTSVSDTMVTLSKKDKAIDIDRNGVAKLYRVRGKSVGKTTLKGTAIGAGAGAVLGAVAGEDCSRGGFFCFPRSVTIPVGAALGAIPGAATGLIIGLAGRNRDLIYESK